MTISSSSHAAYTRTSSSSSSSSSYGISAQKKKESMDPETNLNRIGKLDNSASMQRAIERVSRERTVKKNEPPSVAKKVKVVVSTPAVTSETNSSTSSSNARGSVVVLHASSTKSITEGKRSKATDGLKLSSAKTSRSGLKKVTTRDSSTANASASYKKTMSKVENENKTYMVKASPRVNVMDTVQEEALETFNNETSTNGKKKNTKITNDREKQDIATNSCADVSDMDQDEPIVQDVTPVDSSGKDTIPVTEHTAESAVDDQVSSSNSSNNNSNDNSSNNDEGRDARDITRKLITDILRDGNDELSFEFQGFDVPVTYSAAVSYDMAAMALQSTAFRQWQDKMNRMVGPKRLEIRHVDIHSVDCMDDRVDMIKMNTTCVLIDEELQTEQEVLSGVCYLRDNYVALLIELFCVDDESSWAILVDKPIVPIGSVTALELPVGKVDEDDERLLGFEIEEVEEAFGLELNMFDMVNLSKEAYGHTAVHNDMGMCPSPGLSGEHVKIMYLRKEISKDHLLMMRKKFSKQREDGALVSLRVIPLRDLWKVSVDMKVMCALFLLQKVNHAFLHKGTHEEDHFDDDMSVSVKGRRLVSSVLSSVLHTGAHEEDHFDDDMSVSVKGRRLVSSVLSSVYRGSLTPSRSMEM